MIGGNFFEEQAGQSEAKARIIQKYLWAWAKVILSQSQKIAYIDLFAGPGRYKDGASSTPLLVLETAIQDERIRKSLVTIFNDRDPEATSSLKKAIETLPGVESMAFKPIVDTQEVGDEIVKMFERMPLIPTLFFVDPWGYKGLSLRLINSVLKDWGCDCVFFFNYNRVNMGITNEAIRPHMEAIFGNLRLAKMNQEIANCATSEDRELYVVEKLCEALKESSQRELYVLPFRFRKSNYRTSHHLIFASKHFKGYDIMKGIMAKESSDQKDGVPSFEYSPAGPSYPILYLLSQPLEELKGMLATEYAGKSVSVENIYRQHSVGRPYVLKNYKDAIKEMEDAGIVSVKDPHGKKRRKGSLADRLIISFGQGGGGG